MLRQILALVLVGWVAHTTQAANTRVSLLLAQTAAKPGDTVQAALRFQMNPTWHVYWRNPGDAGFPPSVEWELPSGLSASNFSWPAPEKIMAAQLAAYAYEGEVLLPFTLTLSNELKPGPLTVKGEVKWLECTETACVPADGPVQASLTVASEGSDSPSRELIATWLEKIPKQNPALRATASWEGPAAGESRNLIIEWTPQTAPEKPDFFPYEAETWVVGTDTEILEASAAKVRLRKKVLLDEGEWPGQIAGLVLDRTAGEGHSPAFEAVLDLPGGKTPPSETAATSTPPPAPVQLEGEKQAPKSLIVILALAFVGGMILNFMPCVLPVIALKVLGFVNQGRDNPKRVRQLGLLYAFGVLASFLVLAGMVIAVKSRGNEAIWGMQMQNPYFVFGLTLLMVLIALNLFGVFEITLSSKVMEGASNLGSKEGGAGAFYNGVVATLLATPCTAPFLGVAVGTALAQPSYVIVLTFVSVALGLAFPYVLLCWNPGWLRFLPKPGAWMERFKQAMGFPMLATAVWLFSIAAVLFGKGAILWLGLFLVMVAIGAWIWGEFVQRGSRRTGFARVLAIAVVLIAYFWALEGKLGWRQAAAREAQPSSVMTESGGIQWNPWTPEAVAAARASGRPVLVDFTADWCLTCQVNKTTSIEIESVAKRIKELDVVPFLADFTRADKKIAQELKKFGRAGVPLVVVYPADQSAPPLVLPELLTPGIMLDALDKAGTPK